MIEAMRMNAELARSVIDRFPQIMEAAATLLRAADGAGLPARPGMAAAAGDEDGEEDNAPPAAGFDLTAVAAQVVPMLVAGLMGSGARGKVPSLGEIDWRSGACE